MLNAARIFCSPCRHRYGAPKSLFVFCLLITALFCLTAATNTATAATYYLDATNGDDNNPGTSTAPWKTLNRAYTSYSGSGSKLQEGDTVYLRNGNYGAFHDGATVRTDWVTYKADAGHTPVFSSMSLGQWNGPYDKYLRFEDITIQTESLADSNNSVLIHIDHGQYIKFVDCNIIGSGYTKHYSGGRAFDLFHSSYIEIDGCKIYGDGTGPEPRMAFPFGVYGRFCHNITITDCEIQECNNGINAWGTNWTVARNEIFDCTRDGFNGMSLANSVFEDNLVYDIRRPPDAGAEIHNDCFQLFYVGGIDPEDDEYVLMENIICRRNIMYNSGGQCVLWGFPEDVNTWPLITFENNLLYNAGLDSVGAHEFHVNNGWFTFVNNTVIGNTIFRAGSVITRMQNNVLDLVDLYTEDGVEVNNEDYNLIRTWWTNMSGYEQGAHTVELDNENLYKALFTNYDSNDFTLTAGSTAIDFGSSTYAPATDVLSNSRVGTPDAGCYEYVASDPNNLTPELQAIGDKSVNENSLLTFDVNATDADGDMITYSAQNLPSGATFSSPFSWTPGYSQAGSYQVTFIASDGSAQGSETITITVNNVNRAPVLAAIGNKSVNEGSLLSFSVSATDPDGDTITYSAQTLPTGATFSNRTFSWTPGYDQAGSFEVTFIASDGQEQDSETITVTVGNTNRAPVLTAIGNKTVNENTTLNFSVSATDADGNPITYSVEDLPSGAAFAGQNFIWTPGYDQAGTFDVTFNASDGQNQDSETVTITVSNVNRAPVLDAIADKSVDDGTLLTFAVNATDPDGDTIEYSATGLPSGAAFAGQTFNWTPAYSQADNSYQVTFIASDGQLQDSQVVNIVVSDTSAPTVTNSLPTASSIQAPLNSLITLNITDAGKGVNAGSVTIKVNNNIVYSGNTDKHSSIYGECYRIGTKADYRFIYQPNEMFDYDQTVSITANATDLAGNAMNEHPYSFVTEMRSFGKNKNVGSRDIKKGRPVTVCDNSGNIWAAWHAGPIGGSRDIYIGKLVVDEEYFGDIINLTEGSTADQCNPVIALDSSDKLYVAWQDDRQADDNNQGEWDIYISTSVDGISWSTETRVNDPNDANQVNPAIVIDGQSPNQAYVVWQDDSAGNQDIYIAASSDGFATTTVSQITTNISDQVAPAIAADSDNTIYVVWTDTRNKGKNDIYGAASNNGPWTNIPVVIEEESQSSPAIAAEAVGSILHLVWVDDRPGDDDIFYGKTIGGLSPLAGRSIIDDSNGADQISPVIITTGYTGNDLKVFACWRDERNTDVDLYCVEIGSDNETNVFVGDDGTSTDQSEPAIGIDGDGYPYLVWTNERTEICYAGSTFIESVALASTNVSISSTATVGTVWNAVNSIDDASAEVPRGAYLCDVKITISRIKNPPKSNLELDRFSGTYEFGPSGMQFIDPVTITIPYEVNGSENVSYAAYWYNPLTGTLSQQGITDVETIVISSTLHAVRFKTTHFSAFILGGAVSGAILGGGGGGGGGCSVSSTGQGSIAEFLVPYIGLAAAMVTIRLRDMRNRKARNIKKG